MEEQIQLRVRSAKDRKISEIRSGDERVRVVGLVVDRGEADFVLDDGTGRISVFFDDPETLKAVEIGSKVRVFGTPLDVGRGHELHCEILQRVDMLDLELYEEVRREIRKFEMEVKGG